MFFPFAWVLGMLEPVMLMAISVAFLLLTILRNPFLLLNPQQLRTTWFAAFFANLGPKMAQNPIQAPYISELVGRAHGTVLDIGPGNGDQLFHFNPDKVERWVGVEPNKDFHGTLRQKVWDLKLGLKGGRREGQIRLMETGAEPDGLLPKLVEQGFLQVDEKTGRVRIPERGVFDTIVSIKALCSADQGQLEDTLRVFQALLKPGGEFLFFEHVENESNVVARAWTWCLNLLWPMLLGGCRLDGKLDKLAGRVPGWEAKVRNMDDFQGWEVIRFVEGVCVKAV